MMAPSLKIGGPYMEQNRKQAVALMRYSAIAPLIAGT